jgi:hypothetical protein
LEASRSRNRTKARTTYMLISMWAAAWDRRRLEERLQPIRQW